MSHHATVKIGDFTVPLIGIDPCHTQQECDECKGLFHLSDVKFMEDNRILCSKCASPRLVDHLTNSLFDHIGNTVWHGVKIKDIKLHK